MRDAARRGWRYLSPWYFPRGNLGPLWSSRSTGVSLSGSHSRADGGGGAALRKRVFSSGSRGSGVWKRLPLPHSSMGAVESSERQRSGRHLHELMDKDAVSFPPVAGSASFKVTCTRESRAVEAWILRNVYNDRDVNVGAAVANDHGKAQYVGFDAEWTVQSPVCLLQIASAKECLLIQAKYLDYFPPLLLSMMADPRVVKVGVGIWDDLCLVREHCGILSRGFFDLGELAAHEFKAPHALGMKRIGEELNIGLNKRKKIQRSNWGRDQLTSKQIHYAAIDAIASREFFLEIVRLATLRRPSECVLEQLTKLVSQDILGAFGQGADIRKLRNRARVCDETHKAFVQLVRGLDPLDDRLTWFSDLENRPIMKLHSICDVYNFPCPTYDVSGWQSNGTNMYKSRVFVGRDEMGTGSGTSVKMAKRKAATVAVEKMAPLLANGNVLVEKFQDFLVAPWDPLDRSGQFPLRRAERVSASDESTG